MLTKENKIKWRTFLKKEAEEMGVANVDAFVEAAMFGINKYSLSLFRAIASYGEGLMNSDKDGDNWITDSTVRMFMLHANPPE